MPKAGFSPVEVCRLWLILFWWLGCYPAVPAQKPPSERLLWRTNIAVDRFYTDKLQQLYAVMPSGELVKFGPDGREAFRYNNNLLGPLGLVDATNPFNVLLYYPDYLQVIVLDRTLSQVASLNLLDLGYVQVKALGLSSDNAIWTYDDQRFLLTKISSDGQVLLESGNLSLLLGQALAPSFLLERRQTVFLVDPEQGILLFDVFGRYLQTLDLPGISRVQVHGDHLWYFKDGGLFSYHLPTAKVKELPLPPDLGGAGFAQIQKDRLYVLKEGKVWVYGLTE